jgi:hypothetical protein
MARFIGFVVLAALMAIASALYMKIEPREEQCFHYDFIANSEVQVSLSVPRGGLLDVRYKIFDPSQMLIAEGMHFEGKDTNDKTFRSTTAGRYQICLDNTMSRYTPKWVMLDVDGPSDHAEWTTLTGQAAEPPKDAVTKDDLSPVEKTVERIERNLRNIADLQHTYRWREEVNRDTAESTNSRVLWYSLFICGVAIIMTLAQIFVLKRWFKR